MEKINFKLKEPQKGITSANQKETLIFMIFSYGYFKLDHNGRKKYISIKLTTGMKIYPHQWNSSKNRAKQKSNFDYTSINTSLDRLENISKRLLRENKGIKPDELKQLINKEFNKIPDLKETFLDYIKRYIEEAKEGVRLTQNKEGAKFSKSSIKALSSFRNKIKEYQKYKKITLEFEDIDQKFYDEFTSFLTTKKNHSPNYIGKLIKEVKTIMFAASREKLHDKTDFKYFKVTTQNVDAIYLNENELRLLWNLDLTNRPSHEVARDVFLVGCYTAQRYSDYHRINKNNIRNNNIELTQRKTGEKVFIPIRPELRLILEKYDYKLPKTHEQKINTYIKEVGKLAGIDGNINKEKTRGGLKIEENIPKYKMITTHTARRSGATNMYLAGIPSIDIMKITGHKTEREFLKYIKVSKEETATMLQNHPYFNKPILKAN
jgi:hypothetical protein